VSGAGPATAQFPGLARQADAATLGMWVFLATELMFFGPLFFAYAYGRLYLPEVFAAAGRHTDVVLGTANTAILLTSSFVMAMAVEAASQGARRLARALVAATATLGAVFLAVKGVEYHHEWGERLFPVGDFALDGGGRYFFVCYFLMTGLHALHVTIGICLLVVFALAMRRPDSAFARPDRLHIAALYWHFIDGIWIFLYPILYLVGRSAG
jgi:cytochrome c oxidase subunit 3